MILNSAPLNFGPVNSIAKYVLSLRTQGSIYIEANAKNYLFTNFKGTPSTINVQEETKPFLAALWMTGQISILGPIHTSAEKYEVVTLADFVSDEKAYDVDYLELNYYPEHVIIDFYSVTDSVDIKV